MQVERPLFWIPKKNLHTDSKTGGGNPPKFIGDKANFEQHKRRRIQELDTMFSAVKRKEAFIVSPENELFFEIEFHEKALAKSSQPRKLLEANNIDLYSQKSEKRFFASATEKNLQAFRDALSGITLGENKNEAAYLSAVTKIEPISKQDKLVSDISSDARLKAFLYLAETLSVQECRKIHAVVAEKEGVYSSLFFTAESGAKIIYGNFDRGFIDKISEPDPRIPIDKIEKSVDFVFPQSAAFDYSFESVELVDSSGGAVVGVVDSGIQANDLLKPFLLGEKDYIGNPSIENREHGTFVASRIVFGNDIERQIRTDSLLEARVKVFDVRIMRTGLVDSKEIIDAIKDFLASSAGANIKVLNLSLNENDPTIIACGKRSFITRELDALAYKHKVVFVVSAGNHHVSKVVAYPECLLDPRACITAPADAISVVTVGSVADTGSTRALALLNEPSPFSRVGLDGVRKPDVTHYGGNLDTYSGCAGIGVNGFGFQEKRIDEGVGTSYSAPLVSHIAARLYAYLDGVADDKAHISDLTRALVIHSSQHELPSGSRIDRDQIVRMVGFGIPDFNRAVSCAKASATFIQTGSIGNVIKANEKDVKESKHKIRVLVPTELQGKGKKVKIRGTLVYTPQISVSGEVDYSLVDIDINLHRRNSKGKLGSGGLGDGISYYHVKWNPVKHFEKVFTAYQGGEWEVWLTLTTRGSLDQKKYEQNYALVVSIEDVTSDPAHRVDVHEIIKNQYKEYLSVETRERVRVSV